MSLGLEGGILVGSIFRSPDQSQDDTPNKKNSDPHNSPISILGRQESTSILLTPTRPRNVYQYKLLRVHASWKYEYTFGSSAISKNAKRDKP